MVGDGVNDAPVLARADVSLAMGQGALVARAQADVVVLSGRWRDVAARARARVALRIVRSRTWRGPRLHRCTATRSSGWFALAAVLWGVVGMLVGVIIAAQLTWPELNFGIPWLSYGRLRPLHTNAVIFAFGGCALFATSYHVVQRTCQTRLFLPTSWRCSRSGAGRLVIVAAAITLPLGYTSGKEYAELEWPIDILIAVVWVAYAVVFFGTVGTRKVRHIYVANWFFGAFILAVALLHIVNSARHPGEMKSYSAYAGVQDAMVQWWYGHNAVGFFLTAGFLGMMYYYIPKQAERPVYSYRLSIVHFWALIFTYMWAGPHHLHYTALPDWAQSIGMIFSLVLLAPSWGGMINGIMTLSGAWHKLRDDPILKFLIVSLSFYGMSTFEGPMMSIKTVNALSHYTDWTVGHVHSGALGWVGLISMGALYHLIPRMFGRKRCTASAPSSCTSGSPPSASCCTSPRCGSPA
jgi:cytochrome c oxidase cbb3-type subunit 1